MNEQAQSAQLLSAPVIKRSISISGHSTSVSLEEPFWEGLKEMAAARGLALAVLVREIDAARAQARSMGRQEETPANLSSALRLAVLAHYRDRSPA
jgi:predicted DNA-binding ribbon-helix-helix protein